MIVRKAEIEDIEFITILIHEFYEESLKEYKITLNDETIDKTIRNFIKNNIALVLEHESKIVGMMGGIVARSIFNENQLFAQEAVWYINKDYRNGLGGIKLLKEFERICKIMGANLIAMIHMNNLNADGLNKFYLANDYIAMETHYIKEF